MHMNGSISANIDTLNYISNYRNMIIENDIKFTSIVILTYNQLEYTKLCIESIRAFTPKSCYEIIIVDNNSTDGTVEWLKKQIDLNIIFNNSNLGFPVGCNMGIEIAKGESILLLNNDTIVNPNWLSHLNKALYSNDNIGAVGAITNNCSNGQQIAVRYVNTEQMINLSKEIYMFNEGCWEYKTKLVGFCYLIKKSVLDKVGLLDSIFTPGNYEDDDISLRVLEAGYNLLLCKDTFIHHFGSISFNENKIIYSNYLQINSIKLNNKWGFDFNYNNYIKSDLINMLDSEVTRTVKILQVNCGIGATLMSTKNIFKNVELYGIEKNEKMAKVASGICTKVITDINDIDKNYKKDFFDYIILGDVLEYIENPGDLLNNIRKYLKPNGSLIANIKNANHISTIKNLIEGKFTYMKSANLNTEQLRFFTLSEIIKLFNNSGYKIKSLIKDSSESNKDEDDLINNICNLYGDKFKEEYMSYQYRINAKKIIDPNRYNSENMIQLKYLLMRIDNGYNTTDILDKVFEIYKEDYFSNDINYLINKYIINKLIVIDKIENEAKNRNLNYCLDGIGGIVYE